MESDAVKTALPLIKKYEGFRENAYLCPAGVWTIGYGTTRMNGRPVKKGDKITQKVAEQLLLQSVTSFEAGILKVVKVPLSNNQAAALISFVYNVGQGAFNSSTMLRLLNRKYYAAAAEQFNRWVHGGGHILPGLVKRRAEERALFEAPEVQK